MAWKPLVLRARAWAGPVLVGTLLVPLALLTAGPVPPAAGQAAPSEFCYAVAESPFLGGADLMTRVSMVDPDPSTNETDVGTGTGTDHVEAMALQPGTGVLFAADAGRLGTLDPATGRFSRRASPIGSGSGPAGTVDFEDVDGLTFDPQTGFLYGSEQRRDEDALIRIDPDTGQAVPGFAVGGADYAVIPAVEGLDDVDDLAIDPADGRLYATISSAGGGDRLVTVDKTTGAASDVGPLGVDDMEGLSFAAPGRLLGTTGDNSGSGEALWDIDIGTGSALNPRPLDNGFDYEALACPLALPLGSITIIQDSVPDDAVEFPFSTTGGLGPADFVLDDDPASATARTIIYPDLSAGTYSVVQGAVDGWELAKVTCDDPDGQTAINLDDRTVSIALAAGEKVTCTFVNSPIPVASPPPLPAPPPREAAAAPSAPPAPPAPVPATQLPRTGSGARILALLAGFGFLLGGFGVMGGAPRRSR